MNEYLIWQKQEALKRLSTMPWCSRVDRQPQWTVELWTVGRLVGWSLKIYTQYDNDVDLQAEMSEYPHLVEIPPKVIDLSDNMSMMSRSSWLVEQYRGIMEEKADPR